MGKAFGDGFNKGSGGEVDHAKIMGHNQSKSGSFGLTAGRLFGKGFTKGSEAIVRGGEKFFAKSGGNSGRAFSGAFSRGMGRGGGSSIFMSMGLRIMALGPIIGVVIGAISNLVSGLFAIGSAAASASQSLVALVNVFGAVVQGGVVALVAFGGLGKALSAGMQSAAASTGKAAEDMKEKARDAAEAVRDAMEGLRDAQENAAENIADAIKQIADAKQNLSDTYRDAAQAEKDAIEQVRDAEEALADQHDAVRDAQEALTEARIEAKERLIDLQFAEEGGALAERRAAMELSDARWELNAASELPADNRLRQEAQLAYEEADLNLRMIKERNGDNAEELKKVKKEGINGMDEVVSAQQQLQDAQDGVRDAVEDVNDALRNQRQVHVDNARAIADAQEALAEAQENLTDVREDGAESVRDAKEALRDALAAQREANDGMAAGSEEALKYQEELAKLSPPARRFVEYLLSIMDKLKSLRTAAQAGLFPGLQSALETLVNGPLFPALKTMMFDTGKAIGDAAQSIADDLSSGPFVKSFGNVAGQNATIIRRLGKVVGDLARAFFAMMDAARPLTNRFTKWLVQWADGVRKTTELKNRTGDLTKTFNRAGDRMKVIIDIAKNLWEGLRDIGGIGDDSGMKLLRVFRRSTQAFADFTDKAKNRKMLRKFFDDTATNFIAISGLIKTVGGAFIRLGDNPAIGKIATQLEPVVKKLEDLIDDMTTHSGGKLVKFIDSLVDAFAAITKSRAINVFLDVFTGFFKIVAKLLNMPVVGDFLKLLMKITAALYAIKIIKTFPGIKQLSSGMGMLFGKNAEGVRGFTRLRGAISTAAGNAKAWIGLRAELLKTKVQALWGSKAMVGIRNGAKKAASAVADLAKKFAQSAAGQKLLNFFMIIGNGIMKAMKIAASLMFGPWGLAIAAVIGIFILLYKKVDWFRKGVDFMVDKVKDAFWGIVHAAQDLWDKLFGHSIFPDMIEAFKNFVGGIKDFFTKDIPNAFKRPIDFLKDHWPEILAILTGPTGLAVLFIVRHKDKIINAFKAAKDWVVGKFKQAWAGLKLIFTDPVKAAKNILTNLLGPSKAGSIIHWFKAAKDWVVGKFKRAWEGLKLIFTDPVQAAKNVLINLLGPDRASSIISWFKSAKEWIFGVFARAWEGLKLLITDPVEAAKNVIRNLIGPGGPFRSSFANAVEAIGNIWDDLRRLAAVPVNFIIGTVYNDGIRAALNLLPGVDLAKANEVSWASGTAQVLPGYSPGRDIHRFYSPSAGFLNLSGGEAIMRPEFTKAVGGAGGIDRLNSMARRGMEFASGGVFPVPRGWYIERSPYNLGHDGVDINHPNDSGPTGQGGTVPFMSATDGTVAYVGEGRGYGLATFINSKYGQLVYGHAYPGSTRTKAGQGVSAGDLLGLIGTTGNSSAPHLHFGFPGGTFNQAMAVLQGTASVAASAAAPSPEEQQKDKWWSAVTKLPGMMKDVWEKVKSMVSKGGEWWDMFSKVGRGVLNDAVDWANDKIPNRFLPDNPIHHFDNGGIAAGLGYLPKRTPMPERVLSPRQTQAFERLVDMLDSRGGVGGNNITVHVPHEASARDVVNGIVYELRRMERGGRYAR